MQPRAPDWAELALELDHLLTLPPLERARHLESIAANDAALGARLSHLMAQREAASREGFLQGVAETAWIAPALAAGVSLGAWTLDQPLGEGGMGSVWRAHRSDGRFEGEAAVKVLKNGVFDSVSRERFRREGAILARLKHAGIAQLYDAGITDAGLSYLVLELVRGESIDGWCDARRWPLRARIELCLQVLDAVAAAHAQLVVHRDLKPSNILVDDQGRVRLLDFGIARLLPGSEDAQTVLTREGAFALTARYAAPEQATQEGALSTATDVYALGVVLHELLTGVHPSGLSSATPMAYLQAAGQGAAQRASAWALQPVAGAETPEARALARASSPMGLARQLRGDLDNILARALKPWAAERYPTVTALAEDLRRHLRHEPVSAQRDAVGYRAAKFVRRHRGGVAAAVALVFAVAIGLVGTAWQAIEARRERDEALFQAERALARGNLLNLVLGTVGKADRPLSQREILDRSVELVDKQFLKDPRIAVDLLLPIAGQYMTLGENRKEMEVMQRAAVLAQASGDAQLIAIVACGTVETEVSRGRPDLAQQQLQLGLQALARMPYTHHSTTLACLVAQADVAEANGDVDRAATLVGAALAHAEETGHTRGNQYPSLLNRLAQLHHLRGDRTASLALWQRGQQLAVAAGRGDSLARLGAQREEAVILMEWGEITAAKALIDELEPHLRATSEGNLAPTWFEHTRGLLLWRLGDLIQARQVFQDAALRARAQNRVNIAWPSEFALVQIALDLGQLGAAETQLAALAPDPPDARHAGFRLSPAGVRARLLLLRGAAADAARAVEVELAQIGPPSGRSSHAALATMLLGARAQVAAGEASRALQLAHSAVKLAQGIARQPSRSGDAGEALLVLAQAQKQAGDFTGSAATARQALLPLAHGLGAHHALTVQARSLTSR